MAEEAEWKIGTPRKRISSKAAIGIVLSIAGVIVTAIIVQGTLSTGGSEEDGPVDFAPPNPYEVDEYGIPTGYYRTDGFLSGGTYAELSSVLERVRSKLKHHYQLHLFDCSESSAYVEWGLEHAGYDARIVVGRSPDGILPNHAWVIVYTTDNHTVAVEATCVTSDLPVEDVGIIPLDHRHAEVYYDGYRRMFNDIQAAVRRCGSVEEWDWWTET